MSAPPSRRRLNNAEHPTAIPLNISAWLTAVELEENLAAERSIENIESQRSLDRAFGKREPLNGTNAFGIASQPTTSQHLPSSVPPQPQPQPSPIDAALPDYDHRPSASDHLEAWSANLSVLTASPSSEVNKAAILAHVSSLQSWLLNDLFPQVADLQTHNDRLTDARGVVDLDNHYLTSEIDKLRLERDGLAEKHAREVELSLQKTKTIQRMGGLLGTMTERVDERLGSLERELKESKKGREDDHAIIYTMIQAFETREGEAARDSRDIDSGESREARRGEPEAEPKPDTDWEPRRQPWG